LRFCVSAHSGETKRNRRQILSNGKTEANLGLGMGLPDSSCSGDEFGYVTRTYMVETIFVKSAIQQALYSYLRWSTQSLQAPENEDFFHATPMNFTIIILTFILTS